MSLVIIFFSILSNIDCHTFDLFFAVPEATRGSMRGRRLLPDIVRTRPEHVTSKKGTSGKPTTLRTNYFRVKKEESWAIYQYRVDFLPDIELTIARKALLRTFRSQFNGFVFDGTMLFSSNHFDIKTFNTKRLDDSPVEITVKYTKTITMTDQSSLQVLNMILRGGMEGLKLQLVGRNFFDAIAKVSECLTLPTPGIHSFFVQN